MINSIKIIVKNYLNNEKLCNFTIGTVVNGGVKVSDTLTIPNELIAGNLKNEMTPGKRVRLLRNNGGQQFYVLEVIE